PKRQDGTTNTPSPDTKYLLNIILLHSGKLGYNRRPQRPATDNVMSANNTSAELLIHASWIIPVTDDQTVHQDACLAIADGRILGICPSAEAQTRFDTAARELDLRGHALIPGLVNTHGHEIGRAACRERTAR